VHNSTPTIGRVGDKDQLPARAQTQGGRAVQSVLARPRQRRAPVLPLGHHRVAIDSHHAVIVVIGDEQTLVRRVKAEAARLIKAQVAAALAPKRAAVRSRLDVEHDEREFEARGDGALGEARLVGQRFVAHRLVDNTLLRDWEKRLVRGNLLLDADDLRCW
jgi:hypothetical protein